MTTLAGRCAGELEQPVFPGGCRTNAAFAKAPVPYPSRREQESPCCSPASFPHSYPAQLCSWQGDVRLPWGTHLALLRIPPKQPEKPGFCRWAGLPSIYFSFYPASEGSSACRQYLTLPYKLHLYRLIQTQAINTLCLCTDCRHAPWVPLPGQPFQKVFGKILVLCPDRAGMRPESCD